MKYHYCPKCTIRFDHNRQQCPNCGNYSINCEEIEINAKPNFDFEYVRKCSPNNEIFNKALVGISSGYVPRIELNPSETSTGQNFDILVHSFTKSNFYKVRGSFDEDGTLAECQCECMDFQHHNHYCKHVIASLMMIYKEFCEEKYGKVELLEKKPVKQNASVDIPTKHTNHSSFYTGGNPRWLNIVCVVSFIAIAVAIIMLIVKII